MSEYYKIALIDSKNRIKVIDPKEVDGSYDKKDWAPIDSNTSNLLLACIREGPHRVYTMGDYFYDAREQEELCNRQGNLIRDIVKDNIVYPHNGEGFHPERYDYANMRAGLAYNRINKRMQSELKEIYRILWEDKAKTNVTLAHSWKKYTTLTPQQFHERAHYWDSKERIYNLSMRQFFNFARCVGNKDSMLVNPVFSKTMCAENNPLSYGKGEWTGNQIQMISSKDIDFYPHLNYFLHLNGERNVIYKRR